MRVGNIWGIGIALVFAAISSAHAQGDATRGAVVFQQCNACHSVNAGQNGIGPSLHGLFGRKAGSLPDFAYSPSMRRSGIVWSEAELRSYLPDPQAKVPGTKMTFLGVSDPQQLDDLIAYLKQATK